MTDTIQDKLDKANPNDLAARMRQLFDPTNGLGFGALMAAMRPRNRTRAGLTSAAAQVHDVAALIVSVESTQGTPLAIVTGSTPGAGEVNIDYDATTGVPTITFAAAVTGYSTTEMGALPQNLSTTMSTNA